MDSSNRDVTAATEEQDMTSCTDQKRRETYFVALRGPSSQNTPESWTSSCGLLHPLIDLEQLEGGRGRGREEGRGDTAADNKLD